jgi:regulator-associated protein of mTOR
MQEWENSIRANDLGTRQQHKTYLSIVFQLLTSLYELALDPHAEVAAMATTIVDYIIAMLLESPFAKIQKSTVRASPLISRQQRERARKISTSSALSRQSSASNLSTMTAPASSRPVAQRSDSANQVSTRSSLTETLKRTSSFASTIKSLASYANLGHAAQPEAVPIPPSPAGSSVGDGERINSRPPSPAFNLSTYIPPYSQHPPLDIESSEPASSRASSSSSSTISSIRSLSLHSLRPASPSPNVNGNVHGRQPTSPLSNAFSPGDIVCALIGQDLLQFHQRKTRGESYTPSRPRGRDSQRSALCDQIDLRKMEAVQATFNLDLASGLADILPLKSRFYDWCLEYYKEAQMRVRVPSCR